MELSKRMKGVADMVSAGNTVADVGCDHGYVSIYLIRNQIAQHVIAMDVNKGPLACAGQNVEREGLGAYIQTRLSDGLKELGEKEAQTVICAGMGGRLMMRILSEGDVKKKGVWELVLQPQSEIAAVRQYLCRNGFIICRENMVCEDGKYYQMMRVVPAELTETLAAARDASAKAGESLTEVQAAYGPCLLREHHPVLLEFLNREREKYREILTHVETVNPERIGKLRTKYLLIEEALAGYKDEV